MVEKGLMIVLSGPSGAGKGTIYTQVLERCPSLRRSVSVTTRAPRPGEVEGVHYYFRTLEEYRKLKAEDAFLETAEVYHNCYGTPKAPVYAMLEEGHDVFLEIDVAGAKQIKQKYPASVAIFIMPPSFAELETRLKGRGTESAESLSTRLGAARSELAQYGLFDYLVINDTVEEAAEKVTEIIRAEKCRMRSCENTLKALLAE